MQINVTSQQQLLSKSGSKTIEASPSGKKLLPNESMATVLKQPNKTHYRSKSLIKPQTKDSRNGGSMERTFSLYGLTSNTSTMQLFANLSKKKLRKMANINNFEPAEAANKFYDKNLMQALDKYTSQEKHLQNLRSVKHKISLMKKGELNKTVRDPRILGGSPDRNT